MANALPYLVGDRHTLDVDTDDEVNYAFDVRQWLIDSDTTVASFTLLPTGVTVLVKGTPEGDRLGLLPVKLKVLFPDGVDCCCTARVKTIDDQQFDKTMWFKPVVN